MATTERGGKNRGKQKNDTETLILGRMPPQNIEAEKEPKAKEGEE